MSLIYMHGWMCHWECIVFSPVSGDGGEGENKLSHFFKQFLFLRYLCPGNHGEVFGVEGTGETCQSGTTAVIFLLRQCWWIVSLRELPWHNEQRVRGAQGSLSAMWKPFVEWYRVSPRHSSFMHPLSAHPSVLSSMPNDNNRLIWHRHESFILHP